MSSLEVADGVGCSCLRTDLSHLVPRKRQEIDRAVRVLRTHFVDRRKRAPKRGVLYQLMLVGRYAARGAGPDRETGEIHEYELWAFVDHPQYRGRNRHWGEARRLIASELRGRAGVSLSVFTVDEVDHWRAVGNRFLADKFDGGIVLWDRAQSVLPKDRADG